MRAARGFTLTELMVVVVIMGILATIGFASVRKHMTSARGAEALTMVQSIRAAEERWRAENMMYLDVSSGANWYPFDPRTNPGEQRLLFPAGGITHPDAATWLQLRPTAPGPVRFGFVVNAGFAGQAMVSSGEGPAVVFPTPTDNWYVIEAVGDVDDDGTTSYYRATSLNGAVFAQNHGE